MKPLISELASDEAVWAMSPFWLDSLPLGIAFFDCHRHIKWVNRSYADVLGVAADELAGTSPVDVAGISIDHYPCPVADAMDSNSPVHTEMTVAHQPEGHNRYSFNVYPVQKATGEILGATAVLERITERKYVERALHKSETRLKESQRLARIGSWELDLEHDQLYWSDEIYNIFGIDPDRFEATYEAFLEVVHPDDRQLVHDAYSSSVRKNTPYEVSHRLLTADGSIRYVQEKGETFLDIRGKPLRSIGTVWDITERKLQEEENLVLQKKYHQAQRMETVGRLAGGVAHDFNNMLSVILGRTDLILEQVHLDAETYHSLKEVQHAAERSAELIQQLLAFARRQPMKPVYLNLNEVIAKMLKMLNRLIGEHIDLAWLPVDTPGTVKMDPSQLEQIMANLCVNARDAITGVGHITIETRNVSFDRAYCAMNPGFVPGDYVMLAVSDDGCGMDAEIQQQIFEPFFTTKPKGEGTGLGLATVFGIVKQNDGFINVYSEPGQGTTFKIYLTRHFKGAEALPEKNRRQLPKGNGEVVLLVEDEAMVLAVNQITLEKLNYQVLPANSPSEAIAHVTNAGDTRIRLLMTDVVMPEMNGAELSKIIEGMLPGIPTLYTSAYTANVVTHHGVLKEGVEFLQKPIPRDILANKISELLR
ncbi:MAG: PAS domain-containing protein [Deltaproteobacteria bacterium]|nr:PAS domain-containing protein [Deltaproteobacteria bacterium]